MEIQVLACAYPKPGPGFPTSYIVVCFHVQCFEMRGDCCFVYIDETDVTITV